MSSRRVGLLAQLEEGVLDDKVPLSSLLQKCILLGGQTGSEQMRAWARSELNGYDAGDVPKYRRVPSILEAKFTNSMGYNATTNRIHGSEFPQKIQDFWREQDVDLRLAILDQGIGELEAMVATGQKQHLVVPPWGQVLVDMINKLNRAHNTRVELVYWTISGATIHGTLVKIRTAFAELIAELVALTPPKQDLPDRDATDQAVQFIVTGNRNIINYTSQRAGADGVNTASTASAAPVAMSNHGGTSLGNQAISQPNSSEPSNIPESQGWWARLRKRGAVVAFMTIIGGVAGIVGAIAAVLALMK